MENWKEPQLWGGRWGEDYFLGLCELHTLLLDFTTKSEWPLAAAGSAQATAQAGLSFRVDSKSVTQTKCPLLNFDIPISWLDLLNS